MARSTKVTLAIVLEPLCSWQSDTPKTAENNSCTATRFRPGRPIDARLGFLPFIIVMSALPNVVGVGRSDVGLAHYRAASSA
jgi:hypothetical protein